MGAGTAMAILGGARRDVLAKAPGDLPKHAALGGVLLTTAAVAGVSSFFALHTVLKLAWPLCALAAIGWAVVVLNLDRMLVVTMGGQRSPVLKLATAVPRLLLALVIGWVISTPLVLQIFQPEITAELTVMKAEAIDRSNQVLDQTYQRIEELKAERQQLEGAIGGDTERAVEADQDVVAARASYEAAKSTYLELDRQAQCELDGTCGTGVPGIGESYLQKRRTADLARQTMVDAERNLTQKHAEVSERIKAAVATAATAAQAQLPGIERDLAKLEERRRAADEEAQHAQSGNTGLLTRLEALNQIAEGRPSAAAAHWMLFLLFVCIEVLPVMAKLLGDLGSSSLYDRLVRHEDDKVDGNARIQASCERDVAQTLVNARLVVARQQADAQIEAGRAANLALGDQQKKIALKAIDAWARAATRRTDDELERWHDELDYRDLR